MGDIVGPVLGYAGAKKQAAATRDAAQMQADAAVKAAEMSRFRPVGITTGFGSSQFTTDAEGNVTGAGYTIRPELATLRERLLSDTLGYDPRRLQQLTQPIEGAASSLFGLGGQYLSASPEQAAQRYIARTQSLLGPQRERELASLRNRLYTTGRTGLATGGTVSGGMMQSNPEMAALYNTRAMQDLELARQADEMAKRDVTFGAGLFGTGSQMLGNIPTLLTGTYTPLQTTLGLAGSVEQLGQQPLELGSALGGRIAQAGGTAGNLLLSGMGGASRTMAGITDPTAALLGSFGRQISTSSPVSSWFNNILSPYGGTAQGAYGQQNQYLAGAYANPQTEQARMLAAQMEGF